VGARTFSCGLAPRVAQVDLRPHIRFIGFGQWFAACCVCAPQCGALLGAFGVAVLLGFGAVPLGFVAARRSYLASCYRAVLAAGGSEAG